MADDHAESERDEHDGVGEHTDEYERVSYDVVMDPPVADDEGWVCFQVNRAALREPPSAHESAPQGVRQHPEGECAERDPAPASEQVEELAAADVLDGLRHLPPERP